ncbi:MAG: hypothetical protein M1308_06080 [Actinobacteria bacterium]|nr:hypothetical protein [Actinomycetota bacterium]
MAWLEVLKNILIALVPAIAVAIITAIVTVRKSLRQFYSQNWWQKKADTYSNIMADLKNLFYSISELLDDAEGSADIGNEQIKKLIRNYKRSLESLKKTAAEGDFVISKEVASELKLLIKNLSDNEYKYDKEPLSDYYGRDYINIKNCNENVKKFAKQDLNVV